MIVLPGYRRRALVVALTAIYGLGVQQAHANPLGPQVVNGQAAFQTQGNRLTVTNTPGAIIHWQGFSVGAGETTYFQQQNAASAVLNRVQAQNPALKSQIDGTLGSNGRVFLINPNGIVFGAGSVIDTQGFVASTLNLNDEDFKQGRLRFARQGVAGDIQAQGRISAGNGDVYLLAPNIGVDGSAVISSQGGNIVLAAGEMLEITGRNLNDITFAIQSKDNQALNLGTLSGGAVGVFAGTLTHSGVIQAQTLAQEGGRLVLKAQGNVVLGAGSSTLADGRTLGGSASIASQGGNITVDTGALVSARALADAAPQQAAPRGGDVRIEAAAGFVALERDALVTASGGTGGTVTVRGERIVQDGSIRADGSAALGGSVVVQADSRLIQTASALVSAQGVLRGGNVSVSVDTGAEAGGKLFTSGTLDASAGSGVGGSITVTGGDLTFAAARLEANGDAGGGSIRVGGGRAGKDASVANAQNIVATAATHFGASARVDGDGGTVVAWADGSNRFAGNLDARGGAAGGNGGFIEVSGKELTEFGGMPDASAARGQGGTFLLDPKFIVIQAAPSIPGMNIELLDPNPGASDFFGSQAQILSGSGNILVFNPQDDFAASNAGAIYLYNGSTGALLSSLRGSTANDQIGNAGIVTTLGGGNVLVRSSLWGGSAGALTTFNGSTGVSGTLSAANSLVGAAAGDQIGSGGIQSVTGGKLAVMSPNWGGSMGAVTLLDSTSGGSGVVSAANSLVGSTSGDQVGSGGLQSLSSGKTAVFSPHWNSSAGAITWVDGAAGIAGAVSGGNSLIGASASDSVGNSTLVSIGGGKYYASTLAWGGSAGAVTWIDPASPPVGAVGAGNSLVGGTAGDHVGWGGIYSQGAGKYLVFSPDWNGTMGAVTWFDTATATVGTVSSSNSLVGSTSGDRVGSGYWDYVGGHLAILSPEWNNGGTAAAAGAITWTSASTPMTGAVSAANSLVGDHANDRVADGYFAYLDGVHYALVNTAWNGSSGAVTWLDSSTIPTVGAVNSTNSLVGGVSGDQVGSGGVDSIGSGKALVFSPNWHNGTVANAGAVTWFDQTAGTFGVVNSTNSLVGSRANDQVGGFGDYDFLGSKIAIFSPNFSATSASAVGAITWADVATGITGLVSASNSLTGTFSNDRVGDNGLSYLDGTHYAVVTPTFNGNRGAVTWIDSAAPLVGNVGSSNSLVGINAGDQVGSGGVDYQLFNGKSIVFSPNWGGTMGAVTWFDNATGRTGNVDSTNSLVGATAGDRVGSAGYQNLGNNLVAIRSPNWNNGGTAALAGAVTWVDALSGPTPGLVSAANSLVGSHASDRVGNTSLQSLDGTHYALLTTTWNSSAGAVTWIDNTAVFPATGAVSGTNSLVGGTAGDLIGGSGLGNLGNGKSLILSPSWNGNMGAVTWFDNASGTFGTVDATNSLVGSTAGTSSTGDRVGSSGYQNLGNLIAIRSPNWNNTGATLAGAITFANPLGMVGAVSAANSLVGTHASDRVGNNSLSFLSGNYYFQTSAWNSNAGAVTFVNPAGPALVGALDASNSLVGGNAGDNVGSGGIYNAGSGKYMVFSSNWSGGRGAVTWFDAAAGISGTVGAGNSLVGSTAGDQVGSGYWSYLGSNLAIFSPNWNNGGTAAAAGAVTWVNLASPLVGAVSSGNSLVGGSTNDRVGNAGSFSSGSGYSLLRSGNWGGNAGAVTWLNAASPLTGLVSAANSLVGANAGDQIGSSGIGFLTNGDYYVRSAGFNSGAGAVTIGSAAGGLSGMVSAANSLVGQASGDGYGSSVTLMTGNRLLVRAQNADGSGLTDSGRIHIYSGGSGGTDSAIGQSFGASPGSNVTITPGQITAITNSGTSVVLQANSDITLAALSDIIANNPNGDGGDLTLQAGRSVILNSSIVTDGGDLTIVANESTTSHALAAASVASAGGVVASYREPGMAQLAMADGTAINAGTGHVTLVLGDGTGHAGASTANGTIQLRSITAGQLDVVASQGGIQIGSPDAVAPSDIQIAGNATLDAATQVFVAGGRSGAFAQLAADGQITVKVPTAAALSLSNGGSYARIVNPPGTKPIDLVCINCLKVSDFEFTGPNSSVLEVITASLLSLNPNMLDQIEDTKKSKGDIEVEVDESCK